MLDVVLIKRLPNWKYLLKPFSMQLLGSYRLVSQEELPAATQVFPAAPSLTCTRGFVRSKGLSPVPSSMTLP